MENIRPSTFNDIIGQSDIVEYLKLKISHAKNQSKPLSHTLLLGFSGSGKTTFSNVIARELGVEFHSVMASRLSNFQELFSMIKVMNKNDVLFIDEIHALKPKIQEDLYDLMEDFSCDIKLGDTIVKQKVKPFTLIGATTHSGDINPPLLSRFAYKPILLPYSVEELKKMIDTLCNRVYHCKLPDAIALRIAHLSKRTARNAYNLTRAYIEYVHAATPDDEFDFTVVKLNRLLQYENIDPMVGLDYSTRKYLVALLRDRKPIGAKPLSNMINEQEITVTQIIEPFLLTNIELDYTSNGERMKFVGPFIVLTKQGRVATENAKKYIDVCLFLQKNGWFPHEHLNYLV